MIVVYLWILIGEAYLGMWIEVKGDRKGNENEETAKIKGRQSERKKKVLRQKESW